MAWVRLDDAFYDHPKFANAGPLGMALWVASLAWCNRNLTDGRIPRSVAKRLVDFDGIAWHTNNDAEGIDVAEWLVECGLFDRDGNDYLIHDYLDFQRSAADIRDLSEKRSESGKRGVAAREANRQANGKQLAKQTHKQTASKPQAEPQPQPHTENPPTPLRFNEFYETYPLKKGRVAALRAWEKALKRTDADTLIEGARRYRDDPKRKQEFTAHPATWLNQGRWDDEYDTAPRAANGQVFTGGMDA